MIEMQTEGLIEKIRDLPFRRQEEVEDFVDFLAQKVDFLAQKEEQKLVQTAMKMSENSFEQVWDNEEDSVYDKL